jgi:hypothetical protein
MCEEPLKVSEKNIVVSNFVNKFECCTVTIGRSATKFHGAFNPLTYAAFELTTLIN